MSTTATPASPPSSSAAAREGRCGRSRWCDSFEERRRPRRLARRRLAAAGEEGNRAAHDDRRRPVDQVRGGLVADAIAVRFERQVPLCSEDARGYDAAEEAG